MAHSLVPASLSSALASNRMHTLIYSFPVISKGIESVKFSLIASASSSVVCAAKGPRPRYPRVWKTRKRIGTISKAAKLVDCVKGLSNVKEEVYGALDSFIAWELEFPLITVKKALKTLEIQREWKRIIQLTKWMLSKGQGRTMGSYFTLLNALAEDGRLDEAEELWNKLFSQHLESMPRIFFHKMISLYYERDMHDKLFEIFADMEELGVQPSMAIVTMLGNVFQKLGMLDKYEKLKKKYPPPKWEYRYIRGKRVKIRAKNLHENGSSNNGSGDFDKKEHSSTEELLEEDEITSQDSSLEDDEMSEDPDEALEDESMLLKESTFEHDFMGFGQL
ncbi:pentatricopeptide repeat-containing protein At4g21190 [Cucurbita pepo subsp. pepo]|uniref:pentatricopeptide repeat-containing protein At4g21190 n=1 Tax=Cucurbita pepo subsp. pepo TaxID=3664 RepID=UPI000C9D7ED7|nr:pentatricopeptide repeat-containing protein At4g21190 [Cucurbita pepo subsp. pepo]